MSSCGHSTGKLIECQRLEPTTDLGGAMAATIERLHTEGWEPEGSPNMGFVFIHRSDERRLVMITERDPPRRRATIVLAVWTVIGGCGMRRGSGDG
jgi:hypothetical protein